MVFLLAPQYSCSLNIMSLHVNHIVMQDMFEETLKVYILEESLLVVMFKYYCLPFYKSGPHISLIMINLL